MTWFKKAAASSVVKRRSDWRSSVTWPCPRSRARGTRGSARVAAALAPLGRWGLAGWIGGGYIAEALREAPG